MQMQSLQSNKLNLKKDIRTIGRTAFDERGLLIGWNASGAEFSFNGTGFEANIKGIKSSPSHIDRFSVIIDGVLQNERLQIDLGDNILKITNLKAGVHTVRIFKSCLLIFTYSVIASIAVEGEILPPPAEKARKILAIGDSISMGRVTLARGEDTMQTHNVTDCTKAYPWRTAQYFDADLQLIAASGYGIVSGADGDLAATIPGNFDYDVVGAKIPCEHAYKPDLIIFNLGTNDTAAKNPPEKFIPAAREFFKKIRSCYGDVPLIIFYGVMTSPWIDTYLDIIEERGLLGDNNMYFCQLPHTLPEHTICAHPNDEMGAIYAEITTKFITDTLGWK